MRLISNERPAKSTTTSVIAHNGLVAGSSPAGPTSAFKHLARNPRPLAIDRLGYRHKCVPICSTALSQAIAPDAARRRHDQHPQREQQALNALAGSAAPLRGAAQQLARIQHGQGTGTSDSRCESDPVGNLQTWKTKICLLIPFGPGRSDRACRSGRPWGTRRSGEAAVLYHHVPRIRSGRDLYDTSGRKLRSNPPKPSGRSALDFHGFAWIDPDLHAGLAGSSYSSDDDQLALRYGGGCYGYFRMRAFSPRNRKASYKSSNGAKRLCEHHRPPCFPHRFACVAHRRLRDQLGAKAPVLDIGYGSRLFELIELGKLVGDTKADDVP
ncbi:hypothetical protein ACVW04_006701 [Bradyrhizobium sp. LM2.3]